MTLVTQGKVKNQKLKVKHEIIYFVIISPEWVTVCPGDCFVILQIINMCIREANKADRAEHYRVYV